MGLAIAILASGRPWLSLVPLLVFVLEGLHYVRLHRLVGGAAVPLKYLWMVWMPYPTTIPIGLSMLVRPELDWRGHTYRLDSSARLRAAGPGAAARAAPESEA